jgi:hypothetical protein
MKKLTEFPDIKRTSTSSYNYDVLFNGEIWQLSKGTDFEGKVQNVMMTIRKNAKSRGLAVVLAKKDDDTIIVQRVKAE